MLHRVNSTGVARKRAADYFGDGVMQAMQPPNKKQAKSVAHTHAPAAGSLHLQGERTHTQQRACMQAASSYRLHQSHLASTRAAHLPVNDSSADTAAGIAACNDTINNMASSAADTLQHAGTIAAAVQTIGGTLLAPHQDAARIAHHFAGYESMAELLQAATTGTPVPVTPGGDLRAEIERGNYSSCNTHAPHLSMKVIDDLQHGRALVVTKDAALQHLQLQLHVAPVGVLQQRADKFRVIHDYSAHLGEHISVNDRTLFELAPRCEIDKVFDNVVNRVWQCRQQWPVMPIMIQKCDVTSAFRQVAVNLDGTLLGYMYGDNVIIDLRLQFGWRSSPGYWQRQSHALMWAHNRHSEKQHPTPLPSAAAMAAKVTMVAPTAGNIAKVRHDAHAIKQLRGGGADDAYFAEMYVDDTIAVEVLHTPTRCSTATASLINDHFQLFGEPGEHGLPSVVAASKLTDWCTTAAVLGFEIDTEAMTVAVPSHKVLELQQLLAQWPSSRRTAPMQDVWKLLGVLWHNTYVISGGRYFVWRLIGLTVGIHTWLSKQRMAVGSDVVRLGPEIHRELEYWQWVTAYCTTPTGTLCTPIAALITQQPQHIWLTDASFDAIGGVCVHTGQFWRFDLTDEMGQRVLRGRRKGTGMLDINVLELLGMVMAAYVFAVQLQHQPQMPGDAVLLRGDNNSAVHWLQKAGGARDARAQALTRLMGVIAITSGWRFKSKHIPGVDNILADTVSRGRAADVHARLTKACPSICWQQVTLSPVATKIATEALASTWSPQRWGQALWTLMQQTGASGSSFA